MCMAFVPDAVSYSDVKISHSGVNQQVSKETLLICSSHKARLVAVHNIQRKTKEAVNVIQNTRIH